MTESGKENLESFVTSALRSRLEESARSVVELRQQLTAALEKVESAIQVAGEKTLSIPDEIIPSAAGPSGEEAVLSHLHNAQREMLAATDQVGLLTQLLLSCTVSCPRVAFFIVRKDALLGWAARGFEGARDADMRSLSIGFDDGTILGEAYRSAGPIVAGGDEYPANEAFLSRLGGGSPAQALAIPVFLRDKIAAVLYGDSGQEDRITDPGLPQILAIHAGLCLETLATRQKYPRPRPSAPGARPGAPPPPPPKAAAGGGSGSVASSDATSLSGVFRRPADVTPPGVAAAPAKPAPAPAASVSEAEEAAPQAEEVAEEAPAAEPELSEQDRRVHEEAKRFARLLVSEMVLYNEKQVEEGRRNKDIYERLKDDIDRSLQMYEQRVAEQVRSSSNYFYEEMVRTLANGDRSALKVPWA